MWGRVRVQRVEGHGDRGKEGTGRRVALVRAHLDGFNDLILATSPQLLDLNLKDSQGMRLMRQLTLLFLLFSSAFALAQQTPSVNPDRITAKVRILQQEYCSGDAEVFSVSIKLKIEVANSSKTPVYLLWPMVPWVGKVASGVREAESGRFLYEQTASHYLQDPVRFDRLKIEPGKKVTVQSGYYLIARHNPVFSLPESISAGTYGLVLVLRPEEKPPSRMEGPETVESITTDPFEVGVPKHPNLIECQAAAKAR
jgi:hypothetical protein